MSLLVLLIAGASKVFCDVFVDGVFRRNGTYVRPHYRSSPDRNPYNNYSFPGNVNPYTGKRATGNDDTYLKRYDRNPFSTPSYPKYHYRY